MSQSRRTIGGEERGGRTDDVIGSGTMSGVDEQTEAEYEGKRREEGEWGKEVNGAYVRRNQMSPNNAKHVHQKMKSR